MIKVLATIVVPPHLSESGASRAGEALTAALSDHCNMFIANMGPVQLAGGHRGASERLPVRTRLPFPLSYLQLPNRYRTLFYWSDIPSRIQRENYDLVHIHNPMPALEMRRIAAACLSKRIPYVVSTHGFNEIANGHRVYGFGRLQRRIWKQLVVDPVSEVVRNASAVFALSPADIPVVREFGFVGRELPVVCNGVELPTPPVPGSDESVCARLGIPLRSQTDAITCFFLGNHTPNKGLPDLLKAFGRLNRPYVLVIGGEKRPQIHYEEFTKLNGSDQRIVVTGRLKDEDLAAVFRRSDIFVFPTLADTFPLVVLEAMAHGVPVVASRVGGIPHQLGGVAGHLVAPGEPKELAAAIDQLASDPDHRRTLSVAAQQRVRENFTWQAAAREALASYQRVVSAYAREPLQNLHAAIPHQHQIERALP